MADDATKVYTALHIGIPVSTLQRVATSKTPAPLVSLSIDPTVTAHPGYDDLNRHHQLLYEILLRFPATIPKASDTEQAFLSLDTYYGSNLSKTTTKHSQRLWATGETAAVRSMLQYLFRLVRKSSGRSSSRHDQVEQLKAMVQTPIAQIERFRNLRIKLSM